VRHVVDPGKGRADRVDRRGAAVAQQVRPAPAVLRLVGRHLVAAIAQLRDDAAQEVRVAVVPVRQQGVTEDRDLHAATVRRARSRV
jgi:hypothetical protein